MSTLKVDTIQGKTTAGTVAMPSGSVIQVVNMNGNSESSANTTSSSFTETHTGFRTSITPKFSNSKIFIISTIALRLYNNSNNDANGKYRLYDVTGGAAVSGTESGIRHYDYGNSGHYSAHSIPFNVLMDSWGTTSKTFTFQIKLTTGTGIGLNDDAHSTSMTLMEIAQ